MLPTGSVAFAHAFEPRLEEVHIEGTVLAFALSARPLNRTQRADALAALPQPPLVGHGLDQTLERRVKRLPVLLVPPGEPLAEALHVESFGRPIQHLVPGHS